MASNIDIEFDTSSLNAGIGHLDSAIAEASKIGLFRIGTELLRLSTYEVPHDTGQLQNSASTEVVSDTELLVGYNKVYAAYQHEGDWPDGSHRIKNYQKGRKGHYLSDPLINNLSTFESYMGQQLEGVLR